MNDVIFFLDKSPYEQENHSSGSICNVNNAAGVRFGSQYSTIFHYFTDHNLHIYKLAPRCTTSCPAVAVGVRLVHFHHSELSGFAGALIRIQVVFAVSP